ncbi:putative 4-mercaptohistidine N1-methyltransferase [Limnobacter sp.]|uniref:putative 4-mercaptohistidine N1-methyltransferase n=1 Tax=Limnobacter sp. TaxID=2003368 RepID=UPI00351594A6
MNNPYETDELLHQYLAFHYGREYFGVKNYAVQCAHTALQLMANKPRKRALDLGCAVGRSTFELARGFDQVVGIDLSARFIEAAQELQSGETLKYFLRDEGELGRTVEARLQDHQLQSLASKVQFEQGDACNLPTNISGFDLVFAGNLIDRVAQPEAFLKDMAQRVVIGGLLIISSPYTLLEEYTPRNQWIGGYTTNGQVRSVLDGMQAALAPQFRLAQSPLNVPFVIRETARKFQHSVAEYTVWERLPT